MNCSKCGYSNTIGDRFCKNCGILLENNQPQQSINNVNSQFQQPINNIGEQQLYGQPVNNINSQQTYQQYTNTNGNLDPNYVNKTVSQQSINNIGGQQLYGQPVNNINSQQTYQQQTNNQQYTNTNGNLDSNYVNKTVSQQPINNIGGQQLYGQPVNNINSQQTYQQQTNNQQYTNTNGNLDSNYVNKAVNPNMKKWAILSIVVPVVGIIWYWFIGLSFYIAVLIAAAGFGFAQKGEMSNKKLATIGKVCNGILLGMAIIVFIINLILVFNS